MIASDTFQKFLEEVQGGTNPCKHGVGLYECSEDCPDCFNEALEKFAAHAITNFVEWPGSEYRGRVSIDELLMEFFAKDGLVR